MEIKSYNLNDPHLFRSYAKHNNISSTPYYVADNFLSESEVEEIKQIIPETALIYSKNIVDNTDNLEMNYINSEKRNDLALPVAELTLALPEYNKYDKLISSRIQAVNNKIWGLDITGRIDTKYCVYREGHSAHWHIDGPFGINNECSSDILWRKLSVSIALNDDYEGGEFEMVSASSRAETALLSIKLGKGSALIFPPFFSHRVKPVTKGVRKALIYWFVGPRWK